MGTSFYITLLLKVLIILVNLLRKKSSLRSKHSSDTAHQMHSILLNHPVTFTKFLQISSIKEHNRPKCIKTLKGTLDVDIYNVFICFILFTMSIKLMSNSALFETVVKEYLNVNKINFSGIVLF